ncbi:MAG: pentapeptide repeat-containing protein [Bdellovibrionales bacterium]
MTSKMDAINQYDLDDLNLMDEWETEAKDSSEDSLDLEGVSMNCANLKKRCNSFMNITNSELRLSDFERANMIGAKIALSDLHGSNFHNTNLEYSEIEKCDFSCSDLSGANLQGATIEKSNFRWTDLRGAKLSNCRIRDVDFWGATYNLDTILPFEQEIARKLGMVLSFPHIHSAS